MPWSHRRGVHVRFYSFFNLGVRWGQLLTSRPDRFSPGNVSRCSLCKRLGRPHSRYGQMIKISPPPGFDPRTVHPVANLYTNWAIPAHLCGSCDPENNLCFRMNDPPTGLCSLWGCKWILIHMNQFCTSRRDMAIQMNMEHWQKTRKTGKVWQRSRKVTLFQV